MMVEEAMRRRDEAVAALGRAENADDDGPMEALTAGVAAAELALVAVTRAQAMRGERCGDHGVCFYDFYYVITFFRTKLPEILTFTM